jgi:hypothetical protein
MLIDLTNRRFGRLLPMWRAGRVKPRTKWWHWRLGVADFNDGVFKEEARLHVAELGANEADGGG